MPACSREASKLLLQLIRVSPAGHGLLPLMHGRHHRRHRTNEVDMQIDENDDGENMHILLLMAKLGGRPVTSSEHKDHQEVAIHNCNQGKKQ